MLAGLLAPVGQDIHIKTGRLNEMTDKEVLELHAKYKGLIKWLVAKKKVGELLSKEFIDQIEEKDVITLKNLLNVDNEEAMLLILIVANII